MGAGPVVGSKKHRRLSWKAWRNADLIGFSRRCKRFPHGGPRSQQDAGPMGRGDIKLRQSGRNAKLMSLVQRDYRDGVLVEAAKLCHRRAEIRSIVLT